MADQKSYVRVDLRSAIRQVISSHTAVKAGIATHVEKERIRRGEARTHLESKSHLKTSGDQVGNAH